MKYFEDYLNFWIVANADQINKKVIIFLSWGIHPTAKNSGAAGTGQDKKQAFFVFSLMFLSFALAGSDQGYILIKNV